MDSVEKQRTLVELVDRFDTAMLSTKSSSGEIHSRPMAVVDFCEDTQEVLLITSADSTKVDEIKKDPQATLTFQDDKSQYASLLGSIQVSHDTKLLKEKWSNGIDLWFDGGPESSDAVLLVFKPTRGEYWDTSGAKVIPFIYEVSKAMFTSGTPSLSEAQHAKVEMK